MSDLRNTKLALEHELKATEELMDSIGYHPFMSKSYADKIESIKKKLKTLEGIPTEEVCTTLYFSGAPVQGCEGIDAQFAALILAPFQNMVSEAYSYKVTHKNGKRGKTKFANESRLLLTALPKGSFGFKLVKAETTSLFDQNLLDETLNSITELISSTTSDEAYSEKVIQTDERTVSSLKEFLKVISSKKAGLKIITSTQSCDIKASQAKKAFDLVNHTKNSHKLKEIPCLFMGALLDSRRFELRTSEGEKISGSVNIDVEDKQLIQFNQFTGKNCIAKLNEYVITQKKSSKKKYTLINLTSTKQP